MQDNQFQKSTMQRLRERTALAALAAGLFLMPSFAAASFLTLGDLSRITLNNVITFGKGTTQNKVPTADSAATNNGIDVNLTSPADTTGTNTHNGVNVDLTVGNATGGTNNVRGVNVGNVTGDAQVNVQGLRVGTGTILGTSIGAFVDTGWDTAAELNVSASVDSANTNLGLDIDLASPADTTGTNSHWAINVDPTVGNATGGTNTVRGFNFANVTGDAQVDVRALSVGTGTVLGTSFGLFIDGGWDTAAELNVAATADSGQTNLGLDIDLTSPVDTTGTNTHNAANIDITVGNASGGTNTVRGLNIAAVTGDAQVNVTGINLAGGTVLGTSTGIAVAAGWDKALDLTSAATADSAATDMGIDLNLTTPVDTTGTNVHYGLNIDTTIGNASGGTNSATAINIANVTGDAEVTEKGVVIGTGFDTGLEVNSAASFTNDLSGDGGDQLYGFLQDQVASTTVGITAGQCGKTFVSNSADVMTLPEASTVLGCRLTFVCGTADDFDINPADGTDAISTVASITGTNTTTVLAPSAGDAIRCTDIGSSVVIEAIGADLWASIGNANGIWTDVN